MVATSLRVLSRTIREHAADLPDAAMPTLQAMAVGALERYAARLTVAPRHLHCDDEPPRRSVVRGGENDDSDGDEEGADESGAALLLAAVTMQRDLRDRGSRARIWGLEQLRRVASLLNACMKHQAVRGSPVLRAPPPCRLTTMSGLPSTPAG